MEDAGKEEVAFDTENVDQTFVTMEEQDGEGGNDWDKRLLGGGQRVMCNLLNINQDARISILNDDGSGTAKVEGYVMPIRYSKAPIYELETMVEAVDILAFAQRVIEDRNVSLLLRYFYAWESGQDKRSPSEIFEQVVLDSKQLSLDIAEFDDVMLDVLMFVYKIGRAHV